MNSTSTVRIYVACLASYNNGKLHGAWIDATEDAIREEIAAMLRTSPFPNVRVACPNCDGADTSTWPNPCAYCKGTKLVPSAEEWAIHDYEGFAGIKLSESEDIDNVAALATLIEEHGEELVRAASDVTSETTAEALEEVISDRYAGTFDSEADWAEDFITECYDLKGIPDLLRYHIDWAGVAKDLLMDGYSATRVDGTLYVFREG